MLAWDWWSSWTMKKASLFVGLQGYRGLTLWVWPALGYYIVHRFPTSLAQPRTREGEESVFSLIVQLEHAQELSEEESQSAGYNCLSYAEPFLSNKQPEWMLQSDSLPPDPSCSSGEDAKDQSECGFECQVYCCRVTCFQTSRSSVSGKEHPLRSFKESAAPSEWVQGRLFLCERNTVGSKWKHNCC